MYTEVDNIVSDVIQIYDNTESSLLQNSTARIARIIHYLQRTGEEVWYHRAWPFAIGSDTLTMVAGADTLPTDFARISSEGGLLDANGIAWVEISVQDMAYLRGRGLRASSKLFSIGETLQVVDPASTASFTLIYQKVAPTMMAGEETGFPQPFGQVLLLGTVARLKEEEGDDRNIWRADYQQALAKVGTLYVKASRPQQLPVTIGGMW